MAMQVSVSLCAFGYLDLVILLRRFWNNSNILLLLSPAMTCILL